MGLTPCRYTICVIYVVYGSSYTCSLLCLNFSWAPSNLLHIPPANSEPFVFPPSLPPKIDPNRRKCGIASHT